VEPRSSIQSSSVRHEHRRGSRWSPSMGSEHDVFPHPELVGAWAPAQFPTASSFPVSSFSISTDFLPPGCAPVASCDGLDPRQRRWGVTSSICDDEWHGRSEQSEAGARSILVGKQHAHRPFWRGRGQNAGSSRGLRPPSLGGDDLQTSASHVSSASGNGTTRGLV
jgi:hypothetical protein